VVISQHAHGHILTLIGSLLMPNTSASRVHLMYLQLLTDLNNVSNYSWGAAVLTCLFRALDHGVDFNQTIIRGCMLLLQSWAWYQITSITPTVDTLSDEDIKAERGFPLATRLSFMPFTMYYKFDLYLFLKKLIIHHRRSHPAQGTSIPTYVLHLLWSTLDHVQPKEVIFNFYYTYMFLVTLMLTTYFFSSCKLLIGHNIRRLITIDVFDVSRAIVHLICFSTVKFHQPNRVMRQFGLRQPISIDPLNLDDVHKDGMQGRTDRHWPHYHQKWIAMWNDR